MVEIRGATESIAKLEGVGRATDNAGAKLTGLAVGGVLIAGAALVALGAKAVMMAGDFEQSITKLYTTAGEQQSKLKMVGQGILDMSVQVGTGAQELAKAAYIVESGGYHGAAGLNVLKIAAEGARAENANVTDTASAVVFALNAYRGTTLSAAEAMNILVAATGSGTATLQDFAVGLPNVLPVAAKFHISLTDIAAGMAVMTAQGDDASSAATHLRQVILALEAPSAAGVKALASIGLTTQQVSDAMSKSLPGAIQTITDDLAKKFPAGSSAYNEAIKAIAGGNKQLLALLELSGPQLQTYKDDVAGITGKTKEAGNSVLGWAAIQDTFNFKVGQANAALQKLGIDVGTALLPALKGMLDQVTPLIGRFDDWFVKSGREATVLSAIGTGMSTLGNVVGTTAGVMGNIIGAFTNAGTEGEVLRGALVALAGAFVVIKAAAIPNTILGLLDWVNHMTSAAVASASLKTAAASSFGEMSGLIVGSIGKNISALSNMGLAMLGVGGPITLLIAAGVGLVFALTHWKETSIAVGNAFSTLGQQFASLATDWNAKLSNAQGSTQSFGDQTKKIFWDVFHVVEPTINETAAAVITGSDQMKTRGVASLAGMVSGIQGEMAPLGGWMANEWGTMQRTSLTMSDTLSAGAIKNFDKLKSSSLGDMSQMDSSAKGYWNDVAAYIAGHPINGNVTYTVQGIPGAGPGGSVGAPSHHFASGTSYAPGGWSWVGELGPERMYVPQGAQIVPHNVPHNQSVGMGAAGPIQLEVHVYLDKARMGQELVGPIVSAIRTATGVRF